MFLVESEELSIEVACHDGGMTYIVSWPEGGCEGFVTFGLFDDGRDFHERYDIDPGSWPYVEAPPDEPRRLTNLEIATAIVAEAFPYLPPVDDGELVFRVIDNPPSSDPDPLP